MARKIRVHGGERKRVQVFTGDETIVQQSIANETDVNVIMKRFGATGGMPIMDARGVYGDFTEISDFESAMARVARAREDFMRLDPHVRERFNNDPAQLLDFAQNFTPDELADELGFVIPKPAVVPEPEPPAPPAAPVAPSGEGSK